MHPRSGCCIAAGTDSIEGSLLRATTWPMLKTQVVSCAWPPGMACSTGREDWGHIWLAPRLCAWNCDGMPDLRLAGRDSPVNSWVSQRQEEAIGIRELVDEVTLLSCSYPSRPRSSWLCLGSAESSRFRMEHENPAGWTVAQTVWLWGTPKRRVSESTTPRRLLDAGNYYASKCRGNDAMLG